MKKFKLLQSGWSKTLSIAFLVLVLSVPNVFAVYNTGEIINKTISNLNTFTNIALEKTNSVGNSLSSISNGLAYGWNVFTRGILNDTEDFFTDTKKFIDVFHNNSNKPKISNIFSSKLTATATTSETISFPSFVWGKITSIWDSFTETVNNIFKLLFSINRIAPELSPTSSNPPITAKPPPVVSTPTPPIPTEIPTSVEIIPVPQQIIQSGLTGQMGPRGEQGPRGLTGSQGSKGERGESDNIETSSFVSKLFLDAQVNRIYDSTSDSIQGLSSSLGEEVITNLLTVSGNATIGGDLTITGNITGNVVATINPSFNLGSIPFQGATGLSEDNANLFYDQTNSRLGIGTTTPTEKLNITGNILATGTIFGSNLSGTNTGDNAVNSLYSGFVTNATHTGDATGATALTVVALNGINLAFLGTGLLKNTTGTGVPSIAINSDLPVMSATVGGAVPTPPNNTTTFLRGDGTFATPSGGGDMILASVQTNSGAKTFLDTTFLLRNVANTFNGSFVNTNTANRVYTLKDASGTLALTSDLSSYLPLTGGIMTGGITNSTSVNPLTTLAESWIGPSSTTGVYFKGGKIGIGVINPTSALQVGGNGGISGSFDVQADTGSSWFSVVGGTISFNSAGGHTNAGGVDLGARFNIQGVNDSLPHLAVRGTVAGVSDIVRVSSPAVTTGDYFIIKSDGKVGIGIVAPGYPLHVYSAPTVSGTESRGLYAHLNPNYSTANSTGSTALYGNLTLAGTQDNTAGSNAAISGLSYNNGSGTISTLNGLFFSGGNLSTGVITNFNGIRVETYSPGAGNITNLSGVYVNALSITGTVTNVYGVNVVANTTAQGTTKYGIYIGNQSGATTNWGIYSNGGQNFFAGNVGIGISAPVNKLDIVQISTVDGSTGLKVLNTGIAAGTGYGIQSIISGASTFQNRALYLSATNGLDNFAIYSGAGKNYFAGNVGILTTSPSAPLDISSGNIAIIIGADTSATTRTNATEHIARIAIAHYTNAEEPMALLHASSGPTENYVNYGGGTGLMNAATRMSFYTAANNTTVTGTERMRIDSAGNVGIGDTTPDGKLDVEPTGAVTTVAGATALTISNLTTNTDTALTKSGAYITSTGTFTGGANATTNYGLYVDTVSGADSNYGAYIAGNVGIGTTLPVGKLSISASGGSSDLQSKVTISSNSSDWGQVQIGNPSYKEVSLAYVGGVTAFAGDPGPTSSSGDSFVWNTGIGLYNALGSQYGVANKTYGGPMFIIDFAGGVAIGSYAGSAHTTPPPANGLIISGSVGIGTNNPGTMLTVGTVTTNTGNITVYGTGTTCTIGNGTGATNCTSDIRLKDNVTTLGSELENIMALRPVSFNWKDPSRNQITNIGLIAQEVQALYPNMVHVVYDDYLGIDYAALIVPTIKAVQEMNLKLEDLSSLDTTSSTSLGSLIKNFLADVGNGIENLYASVIYSSVIYSDRIETEMLCVGSTCVTEEQFLEIVNKNITTSSPIVNPEPDPGPKPNPETPTCIPPQILEGDECVTPIEETPTTDPLLEEGAGGGDITPTTDKISPPPSEDGQGGGNGDTTGGEVELST